MSNRNCCSCRPKNGSTNHYVYVNQADCSCQKQTAFDTNLQMTNHYKRVNSAKSIVDTTAPKCYIGKLKQAAFNSRYSTPTILSSNESRVASRANSNCEVRNKCNKLKAQTERSSSVPPRPATRRNLNLVPQNYLKQNANTQIKINNLERKIPLKTTVPQPSVTKTNSSKEVICHQKTECTKKIVKHDPAQISSPTFSPKHLKKSATNTNTTNQTKQTNHIKAPIPTPRKRENSPKQTTVSDYEYLQFSLRITEDIIRNDLYSPKEMRRVFNSHLEANRGRLNTQKMLLQIDHLCKELDIQNKSSRGGKKCCKNDCFNKYGANYCPSNSQNVDTNTKLYTESQSTNKKLINKIFNGHVMTDEEIHNLSENDLQDVISEILNDHEPSLDGEIISLNEDNDLIHNNAAKFGSPSEENLKLLSELTSEESVNVSNAKKVETPVAITGKISDFLQKVSKQISENIVRHHEEQLKEEQLAAGLNNSTIVEEQAIIEEDTKSESNSKKKLKAPAEKYSGGDGQQEQKITLDSNKQSKDSINSGITEEVFSTTTEEHDLIELKYVYTSTSDENQSIDSQTQQTDVKLSEEKLHSTENQQGTQTIDPQVTENDFLGAQQISTGYKSSLKRNSYTLPSTSMAQRNSYTLPNTDEQNNVISSQARNSYTLPAAEDSTNVSKPNSLTEQQYIALKCDLLPQSTSEEHKDALKRFSDENNSALKQTVPSTDENIYVLKRSSMTDNHKNVGERNSNTQATADENKNDLEENSYTLPSPDDNKDVSERKPCILFLPDDKNDSSSLSVPKDNNEAVISTSEHNKLSDSKMPPVEKEYNPVPANETKIQESYKTSDSLVKENYLHGLKQQSTQVPSIIENSVTKPSEENVQSTMPSIYSDKQVTKIFPLSAVNESWLEQQEQSINEVENESNEHLLYFNEANEHMSVNLQMLLEQLSVYEDAIEGEGSKSKEKLSRTEEEIDIIKSSAYSYDNYGIFNTDLLSDEEKTVYDIDSYKLNIAKTVSKFTPSIIENKTERDDIISSITRFILERTFATAAQNSEPEEPKADENTDFISTVEKLVNDRTNDLYQYCIPDEKKSLLDFSSKASLDGLNKYQTGYSKNKTSDVGYKSSKRKSSKSDISEGEISKTTSSSSFTRKISVEVLKKSQPDILQHLKKYESKPKVANKNPFQPCLCDYELKNLEYRKYENYVPKFSKSRFYPTVSTQTSSTDFNYKAGFNDTLLSDGEVHFSDKSESESEPFSR